MIFISILALCPHILSEKHLEHLLQKCSNAISAWQVWQNHQQQQLQDMYLFQVGGEVSIAIFIKLLIEESLQRLIAACLPRHGITIST